MEPKILSLVIEQQAANICICLPAIPLGEIMKEFSCRNKSDNNCINLVSALLKPYHKSFGKTSLLRNTVHFFNFERENENGNKTMNMNRNKSI